MPVEITFKRVQVYHWESPDGVVRFLIPRALAIVQQRTIPAAPRFLRWEEACEALQLNPVAKTLDYNHAMRTDLTEPLLIAEMGGGHILIDGWHRVIKQVVTHTDKVPAYFLTPQESRACII